MSRKKSKSRRARGANTPRTAPPRQATPDGDVPFEPTSYGPSAEMLLEKPVAFFFVLLILVVGAVGVERSMKSWRAMWSEPGLGAAWIWAQDVASSGLPVAFWAAKDVDLASWQLGGARCAILADESYVLWINGRRVGAREIRVDGDEHEVDLYEVEAYLQPGPNRLLVEVASSRGAGGLLANLQDARGRPLAMTDDTWRIFRRHDPALVRGWHHVGDDDGPLAGEPPIAWELPPTGRWRLRPARSPRRVAAPAAIAAPCALPRRVGHPAPGSPWLDLDPDGKLMRVGSTSLFDFGREVAGFLEFGLAPDAPIPTLVFLGEDAPPRPGLEDRRPDVVAVPLPGAERWRDRHPRRFRYVGLVGSAPREMLRVVPVTGEELAAWAPGQDVQAPRTGVFGLAPAAGYTQVEELVWEQLGGVDEAVSGPAAE